MNGLLRRFKEVKVKEKPLICLGAAGQPRGGCPPQEDGRPIETHHALLFSTPLHFLNKGRKQGRARIVQPSAELFDRMQCSAGKPRQSVSRGPLSAQYNSARFSNLYMRDAPSILDFRFSFFYFHESNAIFMM